MTSMPATKAKPLQDMLNKVLSLKPPLEVDGVVGPKTTEALKAFQAKAGLKASGALDAETAAALAEWEHFEDPNDDQYVVSFLIETTRGARLPKQALIDKAIRAHAEMERLAKAEDFAGFAKRAPPAAKEVNQAIPEMRAWP